MSTTTPTAVDDVDRIRHDEARDLALDTYDRMLGVLRGLDAAQWEADTVCTGWTVDDVVGHLIGAAKSMLSLRELVRQQLHGRRHAKAHGGQPLDAFNQLQVDDHAHLSPEQKLDVLADLGPRAARKRTGVPAVVRAIPIPNPAGGSVPDDAPNNFSLGYLNDVLYTRDAWLHRVDVADATGVDPRLGSAADQRLLADVVREWADLHGRPFRLVVEGPAGGVFVRGTGGPEIVTTVRDFLFAVTRRERREGLLDTFVMF